MKSEQTSKTAAKFPHVFPKLSFMVIIVNSFVKYVFKELVSSLFQILIRVMPAKGRGVDRIFVR